MVPEVQKPSQEPCIAFYPKRRIRNLLREKHFHGVSSGSRHEYLLKLRYGKVRYPRFCPTVSVGFSSALRSRSRGLPAAPGHRGPVGGPRRRVAPGGGRAPGAPTL